MAFARSSVISENSLHALRRLRLNPDRISCLPRNAKLSTAEFPRSQQQQRPGQRQQRELPRIKVSRIPIHSNPLQSALRTPSHPAVLLFFRPKQSQTPLFLGLGILGVSAWAAFVLYATNQERLSSSVMRQIVHRLRDPENAALVEVLGVGIVPEPAWYLAGDPWISGAVSNNVLDFSISVSHGAFAR